MINHPLELKPNLSRGASSSQFISRSSRESNPVNQWVRSFLEEIDEAIDMPASLGIEQFDQIQQKYFPTETANPYCAYLNAKKAMLFWEMDSHELALANIVQALMNYNRCDDIIYEDVKSDFGDFECLLHFHKAIAHLHMGDMAQAEQILRNEYSPYHSLNQSLLYRLLEKKLDKGLMIDDHLLKEGGCLDINRYHYAPHVPPIYHENQKALLEAAYLALRGNAEEAFSAYKALKLNSIEESINRQPIAVIKFLSGNSCYIGNVKSESSNFISDYALDLEEILNDWIEGQ